MENTKIHIAADCGDKKRTIYCPDNNPDNGVRIGCTTYTLEGAIKAINKKYKGYAAEYIQKVQECFDGMDVDIAIVHEDWYVRKQVVVYGNNEHRDILVNDPDYSVRRGVVIYGTDKHRTKLLNDIYDNVRYIIAGLGTDKHRTKLLNDPNKNVRRAIAIHGTDKHREALLNDPDEYVRYAAQKHMTTNLK